MNFLRRLFWPRRLSHAARLSASMQYRFGWRYGMTLMATGVDPMAMLRVLETKHTQPDWNEFDDGVIAAIKSRPDAVKILLERHHGQR